MSKPTLVSISGSPCTHLNRDRQRKNLPAYDPDSDLSDSEGLAGIRTQSGDNNTWEDDEETAVDDDSYVQRTLRKEKPLPPITWRNFYREINLISTLALTIVPILALYGSFTTPLCRLTLAWSIIYYYFTGLGITAGYHRLRGGGKYRWWARGHRAHHRYTDTDLDPYSAIKVSLWSHVGWMVVKPRRKPGVANVSDLSRNQVVRWQHRWYLPLIFGMGFLLPTLVAGLGWGDWRGGFFYAGAARLLFVHHSTFCVNSLAHWLGEAPFDDKHSPRDHIITAFVTIGEGYHNFHHEFPQDFRNAIRWYQYDPTKWFIGIAAFLGLASELKTFPDNEIRKGQYGMKLKELQQDFKDVKWPTSSNDLPILTWEQFVDEADKKNGRDLVVVGGFIHDVTEFIDDHPGGRALIKTRLGKDATTASMVGFTIIFFLDLLEHSNAAHNLLAMLRVGVIEGGYEVEHLKKKVGVFRKEHHIPICGPKNLGTISTPDSPVSQAKLIL
ncbi:hypothetical protein PSTT_04994 [Puccinia striiformis]|uniref:Acyl-CoA desaturase n=1 Tax=Puccinia striiformis TaxID=27350 RepID=A0A2S4VQN0_9BASI|nr:hypothetical protein PSTT_04994 [Puccinia striiformis]